VRAIHYILESALRHSDEAQAIGFAYMIDMTDTTERSAVRQRSRQQFYYPSLWFHC
jgi:hypothetical protein